MGRNKCVSCAFGGEGNKKILKYINSYLSVAIICLKNNQVQIRQDIWSRGVCFHSFGLLDLHVRIWETQVTVVSDSAEPKQTQSFSRN